jgi:cobalt/nickel transport protein
MKRFDRKLWLGLFIMVLLSPLGIILPEKFKAEVAWGEWSVETLEKLLGYVPEGLKRTADLWKAPIPDYNFFGDGALLSEKALSYIISGALGIILTAVVVLILSKILFKHEK